MSRFSTMPVKRQGAGKRHAHHHMHGGSWYDPFVKAYEALKPVGNFIKNNKLISKGLKLIPDARAQAASRAAEEIGLGRKRRKHSPKKGGSGTTRTRIRPTKGSIAHLPRNEGGIIRQTKSDQGFNIAPMSINGGVRLRPGPL